jgi:hypothetical protein
LAIVVICSIASLDTLGGGAASIVAAVLIGSGGAELLVAVVREFTMVAVLAGDRSSELLVVVLTGCVGIGGACASAVLLASHVEAALAVDLVGVGSLGAGSSVTLGTGLLAVWSSVRYSVKAASVIAEVVGAKSLVVVVTSWVDAVG